MGLGSSSDHGDLYAVLGVSADATVEEIERAYGALIRAWHPSNYPTGIPPETRELAEERTKLLIQARQELTDPVRRRAFDELRRRGMRPDAAVEPAASNGPTVTDTSQDRPSLDVSDSRPSDVPRDPRGSRGGVTAGYGRLAAWFAFVGVLIVPAYAAGLSNADLPADSFYRYSTAVAGTTLYAILLGFLLLIARGTSRTEVFALHRPGDWRWALWAAAGILVAFFVVDYSYDSVFGPFRADQGLPDFWDGSRASQFFANFVAVAVVAPLVEELIFRGLGFHLIERLGTWTAILVTGVLFGLAHGHVGLLPVFIFSGVALGWLRSRTGSVYPGMLAHGVFNGAAIVLAVALG